MKIAVGLSGGVDSSVVAALLKDQGHDVIGITMKIWDPDLKLDIKSGTGNACYGPDEDEDIEACERLASSLNIPYHVIDLSKQYSKTIVEYFKSEYEAGRTPNPCVRCNSTMKFGFLLSEARKLGLEFDYFATGHYARIEEKNGIFYIKKAVDLKKDQSYFIHRLSSDVLSKVMFPLGNLTKSEVRDIARKYNLEVAEKAESQDFIAGGDYKVLFDKTFEPGDIVDDSGKILGHHTGIINYTVGQRKGLGISSREVLYVKEIDAKNNRIVVTTNDKLFDFGLIMSQVKMIGGLKNPSTERIYAKIRQNHNPILIENYLYDSDKTHLFFKDPVRSVTPGQSVVLYDENDLIIGYGVID